MRGTLRLALMLLGLSGAVVTGARAAETVTDLLGGDAAKNYGWTFNNGQEFPGATGKLSVDPAEMQDGKASLKLEGDFTKGGNYVSAEVKLDDAEVSELSFLLKCPNRSISRPKGRLQSEPVGHRPRPANFPRRESRWDRWCVRAPA